MLPITFDLSLVLQAIVTTLLFAVGRVVYQSAVKLAELSVAFDTHHQRLLDLNEAFGKHTEQDAVSFAAMHDQVQDVRENLTSSLREQLAAARMDAQEKRMDVQERRANAGDDRERKRNRRRKDRKR
jgi:hypothetical protein